MAITYLVGFGMNSLGEAVSNSASFVSIQSAVARPGSTGFALKIVGSGVTVGFQVRPAGGTLASSFFSIAFYLRIDTLPESSTSSGLFVMGGQSLSINADGTLTGSSVTSSNAFTADGLWHQIVVDYTSSTVGKVYVDSVLWLTDSGTFAAANSAFLGSGVTSSANSVLYFSDVRFYGATIGGNGVVPTYYQKLLIPTAGNNAGSWTDGAGGTGDIHGSVDNIPPAGVAAATAAAKIKNAASGTALDYVATMQSYTAAGIPPGAQINAIQAVCNDGEEVATGTKSGGVWCASNPAQSAVTVGTGVGFDYGDDGGALGTYPTRWKTHLGVVAVAPSVTLSTAPTVTVRKGSSTTRVVDVDFMGLYADYSLPSEAPWAVPINQPYPDKRYVVPY